MSTTTKKKAPMKLRRKLYWAWPAHLKDRIKPTDYLLLALWPKQQHPAQVRVRVTLAPAKRKTK